MHILHKILVNIPSTPGTDRVDSREDLMEALRTYADDQTKDFYDDAFDYREVDTAGGWEDEYPENVILGSENAERLLNELQVSREAQYQELQFCLEALQHLADLSVKELAQELWLHKDEAANIQVDSHTWRRAPNLLVKIARLLNGNYFYYSCFYDTDAYTATVNQGTLDRVRQSPEEWALVLFDYHY